MVLTTRFAELSGTTDEGGVKVIRVASSRSHRESASISEMISYVVRAGAAVRGIIRSEQVEAMVAFFSIPGGPVAWWAHRATGVPYVVSLRGGDVPGTEPGLRTVHAILAPFRRTILRSARAIVANSPGLKQMSEAADSAPVHVIPNGVDVLFFQPPEAPRALDAPLRLLFAGRFQSQKNLPWMLERLAEVRSTSKRPFEIDLVGDGPLRPMVEDRVRALGLDDVVRFHGWRGPAELRTLYQSADLVLNPSLYEGMPNVLLEAMACGRPALASHVPGNDAVVADGATGWLFAPGDSIAFRERIRVFLEHPEIAVPLGAAARKRAEREFTWERTTQSYLELLAGPSPISPSA